MSSGKEKEMDPYPVGGPAEVISRVRFRCIWCKRWGTWIDVGSRPFKLEQILCEPCLDRGRPPHYKYMTRLLPPSMTNELVEAILGFAYERCYDWWRRDQRAGVITFADRYLGNNDNGA